MEETPENLQRAIAGVLDAASYIPENDALCFALERHKSLVLNESNPILFLRCCAYDPWKAAERLVEYWKLRMETFGKERCFLPLEDDEHGPLNDKAKRICKVGAMLMLLPDNCGRVAFACDRSKFPPSRLESWGMSLQDKFEVCFYYFQRISKVPDIQKNGFVLFSLINAKKPKSYPGLNKWCSRALRLCFPLHLHAVRAIYMPIRAIPSRLVEEKIIPFLRLMSEQCFSYMGGNFSFDFVPCQDRKKQKEQAARLMVEKYGVQTKSVPHFVGGKLTMCQSNRWYKKNKQQVPNFPLSWLAPLMTEKRQKPSSLLLLADVAAAASRNSEYLHD